MKLRIPAVILFLCTAAISTYLLFRTQPLFGETGFYRATQIGAIASSLILLFACLRIVFGFGSPWIVAFFACLLALPWFVWTELREQQIGVNSWVTLNLPDSLDHGYLLLAKLKILGVALLFTALFWSVLRLLPERWTVRQSPVCKRIWPAFAGTALMLAIWYASAVSPYRVPMIVDASRPDLAILHVTKQGVHFTETRVAGYRDGKIYTSRISRRLFQYGFEEIQEVGTTSGENLARMLEFAESLKAQHIQTLPAKPLTAWNAEGWYVMTPTSGVLAFTSEYRTSPAPGITDLFHQMEAATNGEGLRGELRDVCLGFCYDPLAGLGIRFLNQRCHTIGNRAYCA